MKTSKLFRFICFGFVCFTATSCCEFPDESFYCTLDNRCDETIYYYCSGFTKPEGKDPLSYMLGGPYDKVSDSNRYKDSYVVSGGKGALRVPNKPESKNEITQILILKQSTIDKYTMKEMRENNIFDKLFEFTMDDLEKLNYTIVYTGE